MSTIEEALDGTDYWVHEVDEAHWFILDLGATYTILYVKGRSKSTDDPIDVDIYVSDDKENWGSAVATGISTWQDTSAWVEIDSTDKDGRYIKVIINDTEDASNYIAWGLFSVDTIFDVYADVASTPVTVEPAVLPLTMTLHAPTISDFASYSTPVLGLTMTLHAPTISATDFTKIYGATLYGVTIQ